MKAQSVTSMSEPSRAWEGVGNSVQLAAILKMTWYFPRMACFSLITLFQPVNLSTRKISLLFSSIPCLCDPTTEPLLVEVDKRSMRNLMSH